MSNSVAVQQTTVTVIVSAMVMVMATDGMAECSFSYFGEMLDRISFLRLATELSERPRPSLDYRAKFKLSS